MKKKITTMLAVMMVASISLALEWNTCIKYLTRNDANARWMLQDDGQGVYIKRWDSTVAKPTEAELQAVEVAAVAWKADKEAKEEADFELWTKREKAMLKWMVKELNILRQKAGLEKHTDPQAIKDAIKAEIK